jgi:hypothetical protein
LCISHLGTILMQILMMNLFAFWLNNIFIFLMIKSMIPNLCSTIF